MNNTKFRCWDTEQKKWVKPALEFVPYQSSNNYKSMYLEPLGHDPHGMNNSHLILLQFIELLDVNYSEIFEGDIVKCNWNFNVRIVEADMFNIRDMMEESGGKYEIIGNCFESKHLLKEEVQGS